MNCQNCNAANRSDAKFCRECGAGLSAVCPNGHPVQSGSRFCDECGTAVVSGAVAPEIRSPTTARSPATGPTAERRWVSVMFVDLVGFTTFSEGRDAEDVRELLGHYFDEAQRLVSLYGGAIEKFIGDAVMAVWGTPVAQEDDAERAVRAALDLVAAVAALGEEHGAPGLRARAGVLTGEAAVTIGAEAEGMVIGDLVNTASRVQSAAEPGTVLVGDSTRRATESSIVYQDAGVHEMKGKAEPMRLWRAGRVVAGRRGALKSTSLEAPFVGRDRELRLMKESVHASAEEKRAHLLSVIGIGGIGKSRLAWEFEKYIDGLVENFPWHRGRCLAYGEGVTYWALAEMVRMRARIAEAEDPSTAVPKLRATIEQYVKDPEEREWIEPRLAHLLGLEERTARDPEDLFSAWRLFFERIAETGPTILVFEDMQWADPSLIDFVDYLMTWSKNHPLFVVALTRPEFLERHVAWATTRRGFTPMYLEPLSPETMGRLIAGLVPGLPDQLRATILDRAEGVPLYAVETVRMLLDKGLLVQDGTTYRPTGPIEQLEVPETLQALIAARLDGLDATERRLMQDAAVLGKTFTKASLSAMTGLADTELGRVLTSLVRKEFLSIESDPRSPERGQYGFLQDLVRKVAYETLARKDRKARHLAAAAYLEGAWGAEEDEIVEVLAAHYLEAYNAVPNAPDTRDVKAKARDALARAGKRAASLAAGEEARRYFEQAIELADDPLRRAELHESAAGMARLGAKSERAAEHYEAAMTLYSSAGQTHPAARASAAYANVIRDLGRGDEALRMMESAFEVLSQEEPDGDLAEFAAELGRQLYFAGRHGEAAERIELALRTAEVHELPETFSQALNTRSLILQAQGRSEESLLLQQHALHVALENDLSGAALRSYANMCSLLHERTQHEEELDLTVRWIDLATRVGNWRFELAGRAAMLWPLYALGRWDELVDLAREIEASEYFERVATLAGEFCVAAFTLLQRGEIDAARGVTERSFATDVSTDIQDVASNAWVRAWLHIAEGSNAEALSAAEQSLKAGLPLGIRTPIARDAFVVLVEAAVANKDIEPVERTIAFLDGLKPGERTPFVEAHAPRFRARLAIMRGVEDGVEDAYASSASLFRELQMPFWLAVTLLEHGEWLVSVGRGDEARPLLDEAREIFTKLGARPWLERLAGAAGSSAEEATMA